MRSNLLKLVGLILVCFFSFLPMFIETYVMHLVILIFYFSYLSCSWNIIGGFAGQLSLGHALFLGIGAYTSTLLFVNTGLSPWIGMVLGGIIASFASLLMGLLIFRYKIFGVFFAITTLAFAEIARIVAGQFRLFGGSEGILIPLQKSSIWNFQFETKSAYYYVIFIMMLCILIISYALRQSKYYYYLSALKADNDAANALGVNARKYKTLALIISAFFTALGGTFFAQYYMFIEPHTTFGVMISVDMIIRPIIGGVGTVLGPVIGSFVMTPLSEVIRATVGSGKSGVHLLIYGGALIAICIWMPKGIFPYIVKLIKKT